LDYGCGKGAFLRAFSHKVSNWELVGLDQTEVNRAHIEQIPEASYMAIAIKDLHGHFDLISLVHVLEHIVNPMATLNDLRGKLAPNGSIFIQVPHLLENPFDIAIADHCSHFTVPSLTWLLEQSGYEVIDVRTDWVRKEVSAVARCAASSPATSVEKVWAGQPISQLDASEIVKWLEAVSGDLGDLRVNEIRLGILGTTNAALWVDLESDQNLDFFVDESPLRHGKHFYGKSVLPPEAVPQNALVYLPFVPSIAKPIADRLKLMGLQTSSPPELILD